MYTYPTPQNLPYPARVLFDEGALSRSAPSADRARAGRTGAPRSGRQAGGQGGAPGGAAPYVTGRARCLAARGGYVNPASRGARWCPGASRRSTPSLGFARDWQTSDALRRENAEAWLFESRNQNLRTTPKHICIIRGLDSPAGPKRRPAYPSIPAKFFRRRCIAGSSPAMTSGESIIHPYQIKPVRRRDRPAGGAAASS
jgi:hypothetical protein